jgi:hypothetical protein
VGLAEQRTKPELWLIEADDFARHPNRIEFQTGALE